MSPYTHQHVICFRHCRKNVFVFSVPIRCPLCNQILEHCKDILPFALPHPFVNATQTPCSVVLRPSRGDFLRDFQNSINLHIALTDSKGSIVEFDASGLICTKAKQVDKSLWGQCLVVADVPDSWFYHWDCTLLRMITEQGWNERIYDADDVNCYNFVLKFLQLLKYMPYMAFAENTETFTKELVVPKTTHAGKYITIYRNINEFGYWAEPNS
ncbi:MKRN2 opposite strand protein [Malaya genurostris]|uniref:MKRN2 opposite strand protein n=1 Tax=Malaya genurostris TaxID=325434 RepID=UPI0026F3B9A2|nr:MKRN2 opposite strand protein [Malaya genurostris]XP_058452913.1 MKRN2 opposite strand protein [Malaya genurostris]XP_058452914.1 MKRN2 opposite strand protein [Malaya genurostris]XP_058452915.1 MKRN2 opposite strand protein [Malaya genurostris]XP_058452916.1 MKRN2 opposite strand protein [Malaya genurostris]